jgi:hypothetical protein
MRMQSRQLAIAGATWSFVLAYMVRQKYEFNQNAAKSATIVHPSFENKRAVVQARHQAEPALGGGEYIVN